MKVWRFSLRRPPCLSLAESVKMVSSDKLFTEVLALNTLREKIPDDKLNKDDPDFEMSLKFFAEKTLYRFSSSWPPSVSPAKTNSLSERMPKACYKLKCSREVHEVIYIN